MEEKDLQHLFESMTVEEKLGQMTQTTGEHFVGDAFADELVVTGPSMENLGFNAQTIHMIGSVLGVSSAKAINAVQRAYLSQSRLKIPLMFMHDAIHGYRTIFPIPLAMASSFDPELVKEAADVTAREMRSAGIQVDFSPMCDLVRDARWGRVMESFGEDSILSGRMGQAMISGYQGSDDGSISKHHVAACLKHFAAYGAPDAGRDYASVDMSNKEFFGFYAKPYELALQAQPRMVMASFNSLNGEPATASKYLLEEILRGKYGFIELLISDWGAVAELKNHGLAEEDAEAGRLAMSAGIEIEMVSNAFLKAGIEFSENEVELLEKIDKAVWKILQLKNELGLFEHPYADETLETQTIRSESNILSSRKIAEASCVLLKNDHQLLPLAKNQPILIIGPFAKSQELLGHWSCKGRVEETFSVERGFKNLARGVHAYEFLDEVPEDILKAADTVIVTIGEAWDKSGEGHSSVNLEIDSAQKSLIFDLKALDKKIIALAFAGRPMALGSVLDDLDALLWTWYLGNEAGNAIAALVLGLETPTGRLPMSFPRVSSQMPLRYNELRSGRPANASSYSSRYQDLEIGPLFPFGYGLRYGEMKIDKVQLTSTIISDNQPIELSLELTNKSQFDSTETLILFMEDPISRLVRPVREMIDFQKIFLKKSETVKVIFKIKTEDLAYTNNQGQNVLENGRINFYINDLKQVQATVEVKN
ncbi:MAG: glycoside hydrolase family 3 C-terminal domain-containing protein [Streptococcaceae bacterium]|jgi:beta-glucosidase|nr:glycoside hydrolase family 3 C-terminal domain-containing protein [Streptococcaceae bacterium]